jgi:hypothetical protein
VVPVIVRQCLWQSDPVLGALQALPRHGRPVITFRKHTGARSQVWTEIAQMVEAHAKGR